jgi:hypothetical protein
MAAQNNVSGTAPNPDVISAYGYGWKQLWKPFWMLLLIGIIYFLIGSVISVPQWIITSVDRFNGSFFDPFLFMFSSVYSLLSLAFGILVTGPIAFGISYAFLKAVRGEEVDLEDMFAAFRRNYWHTVLAYFLMALIIGVGFIFLIIPGIYLACKLAFIPYLVVDKKMDGAQAISASWKMTNGYGWQVFLIGLLGFFIVIAGFICLIIGVIISIMWINITLASLYYAVDSRNPSLVQVPPDALAPPITQ